MGESLIRLFNDAFYHCLDDIAQNKRVIVNDELETMWKWSWAYFRAHLCGESEG